MYTYTTSQQQQPIFGPKILESAMDPQQTSKGQQHVFISANIFYPKSYSAYLKDKEG